MRVIPFNVNYLPGSMNELQYYVIYFSRDIINNMCS